MSNYDIEHAYQCNIKTSVANICNYVKAYAISLEVNKTGYTVGWGKWNAIKSTTIACYKFYTGAKKIIRELTDSCVVDLCNLSRLYLGDLSKINLLHEPSDDDIDLLAEVRAFEIAIVELTRLYLKNLRRQKRNLHKRKFEPEILDSQFSYLTYKIDQVKQINTQVKSMFN